MSTIKFLKTLDKDPDSIPDLADLTDPQNKILLDLKKRNLITFYSVYLNNGHPGAHHISITKEGLEYIEKHQETNRHFIVQTLIGALISIITGVTVTLILVYLFHIK